MGYGTKLFQEFFLDNASLIGLQRRSGEAEATPQMSPSSSTVPPALLHNLRLGALAPSAASAAGGELPVGSAR